MSAKFKPGDVVRHAQDSDTGATYVVSFCGETWFVGLAEDGTEFASGASGYELAPPPLPEPYIGYTHGDPYDGVPTVYPMSTFLGSGTFYGSDVYEVEVRYIRKLDTSRPRRFMRDVRS